jgi:translocator protein
MGFYESLVKPSWVPPDWAFPLAWFSLWALQAVALVRLAGSPSPHRRAALVSLVAQFVVAIAWQAVIFAPGRLLIAAWWLVAVIVLVVLAVALCWRADRLSAVLVAPTIVWVSVATTLGWSLYQLNPNA